MGLIARPMKPITPKEIPECAQYSNVILIVPLICNKKSCSYQLYSQFIFWIEKLMFKSQTNIEKKNQLASYYQLEEEVVSNFVLMQISMHTNIHAIDPQIAGSNIKNILTNYLFIVNTNCIL